MERIREQGTIETLAESGSERMAAIRRVVADCQYAKIDGTMIDLSTAGAIVTVYDALSPENQAKFTAMPAGRMGIVAWELCK